MASEQAKRMGRRLRERRKELGLTQRELADLHPSPTVTSDYVSKWERGEHGPSENKHLAGLLKVLGITEADLRAGPIAEREPQTETPDLMATVSSGREPTNADLAEMLTQLRAQVVTLTQLVVDLSEEPEGPSQEDELSGEG